MTAHEKTEWKANRGNRATTMNAKTTIIGPAYPAIHQGAGLRESHQPATAPKDDRTTTIKLSSHGLMKRISPPLSALMGFVSAVAPHEAAGGIGSKCPRPLVRLSGSMPIHEWGNGAVLAKQEEHRQPCQDQNQRQEPPLLFLAEKSHKFFAELPHIHRNKKRLTAKGNRQSARSKPRHRFRGSLKPKALS
jgi:hypothetical protein